MNSPAFDILTLCEEDQFLPEHWVFPFLQETA